ncbi:SDR family oxidoreductase [Branchiibius sp. NY16-3462-2]|uniref:SDR family oxidoreductase n=1 Tax=Branchiibius sp. NY16-3462-2 TaxID=1807500 RepID=UPI000794CF0E|nr:SDR family oxidoreductase [Branchiibius sp. NY16-3462-2]KYH43429.1 sugar dehydrogenase [Branchiibius sp. NY16-3462-2]
MGNEVYLVTGGTRGIGAATARQLAGAPGRTLVLAYRSDAEAADRIVAELDAPGSPVIAVRCDVADPSAIEELFRAVDGYGDLAALVNSAGIVGRQSSFVDIDADRWRNMLQVNVIGTALCCREAVVRMRARPVGVRAIVNISSKASVLGSPNEYVDYAASKGAVDSLTRGLALEVAAEGIRVNSIRAGIIDTDIHILGGEPRRADRVGPMQPMGRAGTAEEVADTVTWLLSDRSSYVTGAFIDVSGGR